MAIHLAPLPLPASADASKFARFGRQVTGVDPGNLTSEQFGEIRDALHKYDALLFRDASMTPEQQYALTKLQEYKAFDPASENYGHGNNKTEGTHKSILHPDLKTIPRVPQVQLIGNGTIYDHEGLAEAKLKHPSHKTFHKTVVSPEDEAAGVTRFYRWHIDAALYDLSPPRVTTLYGLRIPQGAQQVCRYDDGSGDELPVPLGTTAFVSGKTMFGILPRRSRASLCARALSTRRIRLEMEFSELPPWEEARCKTLPMLWKTPSTGELSFQVHPCGVAELLIDPLPAAAAREGALYPDGAPHGPEASPGPLVHDAAPRYRTAGPSSSLTLPLPPSLTHIAPPQLVYPHDWQEKDLVLFHNRGVLHTVVGAFAPDQVRAFHQCNLAASDDPAGPSAEDVQQWA
ncbi:Clavaminate synthase-like protein [Mycena leptocephala]|nr:Clavaminate synthase-like protein [Mycena leptocephala]